MPKEHKRKVVKFKARDARQPRHVELVPRNVAQENYVNELNNKNRRVILSIGPAGTGKTLLATLKAIQTLLRGDTNRIIITRPSVGAAGENHGFLPGDINEKMEPWVLPILDIFYEYWTKEEVAEMILKGVIEIAPLMYMRGRTFKDSYILLDEAQNCTPEQMKLILTRLGHNTRIFVTGDLEQTDHKKSNGLKDIAAKLAGTKSNSISICTFGIKDVERDPIVQEILDLYNT